MERRLVLLVGLFLLPWLFLRSRLSQAGGNGESFPSSPFTRVSFETARDGKGIIPDNLVPIYRRWGETRGLDWRLIAAIAKVESDHDPWELNPRDPSAGLMGTQPRIVWTFGLNMPRKLFTIGSNQDMINRVRGDADLAVKAGSGFLRELWDRYKNTRGVPFILTAYNVGEPKALAGVTNPDYLFTVNGKGVMGWWSEYTATFSV